MRRSAALLALLALCSTLAGCSAGPSTSLAIPRQAAPSAEELASVARSNNAFALDLYARSRAKPGNLAVSPLSISTALTMTWAGARGETADQMKKALRIEGSAEATLSAEGKLLSALTEPGQPVTLRIANRLFADKACQLQPPFLALTGRTLGASLERLDFAHDPEASRVTVNDWIAKATEERIQDLIPAGGVSAETTLALTNAIYFMGKWASPFRAESTSPAPFLLNGGASKEVPTMRQGAWLRFAATDGVKVLDMPFVGGALAMTLVLPDAVAGLGDTEARLSPALLASWVSAMKPVTVDVALPKFEINPAASLALADTLKAMGMGLAFDAARADLTGLATPPPGKRLVISDVFHKAMVKVDEAGTEAAAATAVIVVEKASAAEPERGAEFHADHPFLFLLRHVASGAILFMGRVDDPSSK